MTTEKTGTTSKSAAERMWGEMLPIVRALLAEEDAEFADLTIEDCFNGMYGREEHLDLKTRELCTIAMLAALGKAEELDLHFLVAFNLGWGYAEIREMLTLMVLPAGWPCAIDALRKLQAWCKANQRETAPGIRLRDGFETTDWYALGSEKGAALFGGESWQRLLADLDVLDPALRRLFVSMFYGKLMSRAILDEKTRQIGLVAAFAARRSTEQLKLHIRGALAAGVSEAAIREVLFYVGVYAGHEAILHGVCVWKALGV